MDNVPTQVNTRVWTYAVPQPVTTRPVLDVPDSDGLPAARYADYVDRELTRLAGLWNGTPQETIIIAETVALLRSEGLC